MVAPDNTLPTSDQYLRPASVRSMQNSTTTTQVDGASAVPSVLDKERAEVSGSQSPSETASNVEKLDEKKDVESGNESDSEIEYPKSWKLALISLALCLSVFCMALVRIPPAKASDKRLLTS